MRCFLILAALALASTSRGESIILATTTTTQDTGLIDVLVPAFTAESGVEVKVIAVASGAALKMAERGDADALLVHSPAAEATVVAHGDLVEGRAVMHSRFLIVGPKDDPAGAHAQESLAGALAVIAHHGNFVSRGDASGTQVKELDLWKSIGVDPSAIPKREETGQGMGNTLQIASEHRAYCLTESGTWRIMRAKLDLMVVFDGDPQLGNPYHAYVVDPKRHPAVKAGSARKLVEFLTSDRGRALIAGFKVEDGQPLFVPEPAAAADAP